MLVIYFKNDGEIHQVAPGYKDMEGYYGNRCKEFGKIFDCIVIEQNDYVFNNFFNFEVDIETKELVIKDNNLIQLFKKSIIKE